MATLILSAAGQYVGGPIGSAVGANIGAQIDSKVIYPALFPPERVKPAPIDAPYVLGKEGSSSRFPVGSNAVVQCFPIWAGPLGVNGEPQILVEVSQRKSVPDTYYYFLHLAYAAAIDQQITTFKKIWMDGDLVYNDDPLFEITTDQLELSIDYQSLYPYGSTLGLSIGLPAPEPYLIITSPEDGPDLSIFTPGQRITVSGSADSGNNGEWLLYEVRRNFPTTEVNTVLILFPIITVVILETFPMVGDTPPPPPITETIFNPQDGGGNYSPGPDIGSTITLSQEVSGLPQNLMEDIRFYTGSPTQVADPLIAAQQTNAPGHRGIPHFVVQKMLLQRFGNRAPSEVTALVEVESSYTLGDAISDIITNFSPLSADDIDVSTLTEDFEGGTFESPMKPVDALNTLMLAYNVVDQERDGKIHFTKRDNYTEIDVIQNKVTAKSEGEDRPRPFDETRQPKEVPPRKAVVSYFEPQLQYAKSTRASRRRGDSAGGVVAFDLPLVLSNQQAMEIANRKTWSDVESRFTINGTLPPSLSYAVANDVLRLQHSNGRITKARIRSIVEGANGLLEYEAILESRGGQSQSGEQDTLEMVGEPTATKNYVLFTGVDIPPLRDADATRKGFYFSGLNNNPSTGWQGAVVYESQLPDSEYQSIDTIDSEGRRAFTVDTSNLSDDAVASWWDEASHIDIRMLNTSPSRIPTNATRSQVLNGRNWILVGGEIIGYRTATLLSGGVHWRLSGLLRGLRNTDHQISQHAVNGTNQSETVVFLDPSDIKFRDLNQGEIGSQYFYKAVPPFVSVDGAEYSFFELLGNTVKPFSPVHVRAHRRTSAEAAAINAAYPGLSTAAQADDLVFRFTRRTRLQHRLFGNVEAPLDETGDAGPFYIGFMFDGSDDSYLRLISNDHEELGEIGRVSTPGLEQCVYYKQWQQDDGLTVPSDTVKAYFAQVRDVGGIGFTGPTGSY